MKQKQQIIATINSFPNIETALANIILAEHSLLASFRYIYRGTLCIYDGGTWDFFMLKNNFESGKLKVYME